MPDRTRGMRSAPTLAFLLVGALAVVALAACGDDDEPPADSPTAPASATSTGTVPPTSTALGPGGGEPPGAATVEHPTPLPTVTAVPAGWATFTQEASSLSEGFSFSYPKGWFAKVAPIPTDVANRPLIVIVTPWDTTNPPPGAPPPGSLKVDVAVTPPEYTCGGPEAEAAATETETLGGMPAKRLVVDYPEEEGELVRSERVWVERDGRLYCVAAYHTGPLTTEETFATLLHSFEFTD